MDPISIATGSLALAKTAFRIAVALHSGFEAVNSANTTLQVFHGEVTALANSLDLVGKTCEAPRIKDLGEESLHSDGLLANVLRSLEGLLSDCKDTLARLDAIVQQAKSKSSISIFRRSSTALKLNLNSANLALVRQQIQTYISAMQMTISMLNMYVTSTAIFIL